MKMKNFGKGNNSEMTNTMDKKKIQVSLIFILYPHTKFHDPISNGFWPCVSVRTDGQKDRQAQTNMPPHFLRSLGHKNKEVEFCLQDQVQSS